MKKRFKDLTDQEQIAFVHELARMQNFGSACLTAAAINLNKEEEKGWPMIAIESSGEEIQVSLCDGLDLVRDSAKVSVFLEIQDLTKGLFGFLLASSMPDPEELAIHSALHDAFCLGVAAVSLMEMDFSGAEDILAQIEKDNDE